MAEKTTTTTTQAAPTAPADATTATTENDLLVKRGFRKIKIEGLAGTYRDTRFDDDGVCEISDETLEFLKKDFPPEVIKEIA